MRLGNYKKIDEAEDASKTNTFTVWSLDDFEVGGEYNEHEEMKIGTMNELLSIAKKYESNVLVVDTLLGNAPEVICIDGTSAYSVADGLLSLAETWRHRARQRKQ